MTSKIKSAPPLIQELYQKAIQARENAYVPYSQCKVGAAIYTKSGHMFSGCNVENSSFGGTNCAERVAIQKAISEIGQIEITDVLVVTNANPPWPPCGMCRQVIAEFGSSITLHTTNLEGAWESFRFQDIFPMAFTPSHLQKNS